MTLRDLTFTWGLDFGFHLNISIVVGWLAGEDMSRHAGHHNWWWEKKYELTMAGVVLTGTAPSDKKSCTLSSLLSYPTDSRQGPLYHFKTKYTFRLHPSLFIFHIILWTLSSLSVLSVSLKSESCRNGVENWNLDPWSILRDLIETLLIIDWR